MAERRNPNKDSYAPVTVQLDYKRAADTPVIHIPAQHCLQSVWIEYSASSTFWKGTLTLLDPAETFFKNELFVPAMSAQFAIKWAFTSDPNGMYNAPTYIGRITRIVPSFTTSGIILVFDLVDDNAPAPALDKNRPPRAFKAGMKASDIVRKIAEANRWTRLSIEETVGTLPELVMTVDETHASFIQDRIVPLSRSDNNRAFKFFTDPQFNRVHFHTDAYPKELAYPEQPQENDNAGPSTFRYVYARDRVGEVESFAPSDNTMFAWMGGGGDGSMQSIDSKGGVPVEHTHTADGGVTPPPPPGGSAAGVPQPPARLPGDDYTLDIAPPAPEGVGNGYKPEASNKALSARSVEEATHRAIGSYAAARSRAYQASLTVKGNHWIKPSTVIEVLYFTPGQDKPHYLSGRFNVFQVKHTLDGSGFKTEVEMQRDGLPAQVAGAQKPPGKIREFKGEELTVH